METENTQDSLSGTEGYPFVPILHEPLLRKKGRSCRDKLYIQFPYFHKKRKIFTPKIICYFGKCIQGINKHVCTGDKYPNNHIVRYPRVCITYSKHG